MPVDPSSQDQYDAFMLDPAFQKKVLQAAQAEGIQSIQLIQQLWSGYGEILRVFLKGSPYPSVVVKQIRLPQTTNHPRGWNTDVSHQRKVKSYQHELTWYSQWNSRTTDACRTPRCLTMDWQGEQALLVLEDLTPAGYPLRKNELTEDEMAECLRWLASFHATFLGDKPEGLWKIGTYWHLDTRPEELHALDDKALKAAAPQIDALLQKSPFQTLVHGDAKVANFCFSSRGNKVAAVDFQYTGGGVGVKDLAYFVGSVMGESQCEKQEDWILDTYFKFLKEGLARGEKKIPFSPLEENWRSLYPLAWTDFHRFLKGWSPGHWKINTYSERLSREVVAKLSTRA